MEGVTRTQERRLANRLRSCIACNHRCFLHFLWPHDIPCLELHHGSVCTSAKQLSVHVLSSACLIQRSLQIYVYNSTIRQP